MRAWEVGFFVGGPRGGVLESFLTSSSPFILLPFHKKFLLLPPPLSFLPSQLLIKHDVSYSCLYSWQEKKKETTGVRNGVPPCISITLSRIYI